RGSLLVVTRVKSARRSRLARIWDCSWGQPRCDRLGPRSRAGSRRADELRRKRQGSRRCAVPRLLSLRGGELRHLGPLVGVAPPELAELLGRDEDRPPAHFGEAPPDPRIPAAPP